jgi:hypothetical protein
MRKIIVRPGDKSTNGSKSTNSTLTKFYNNPFTQNLAQKSIMEDSLMMNDSIKINGPNTSNDKSYLNYNHNEALVIKSVATESNKEILSHRVHDFFKAAASHRTSPRQPMFFRSP